MLVNIGSEINKKKSFEQATMDWNSIQFLSSVISRDNEIGKYLVKLKMNKKIDVCAS